MATTMYGFNILSKYAKKTDLVNYLNELHKSLSQLSQEINDRPKGLKQTALQLVEPKLLSHTDKDVRVLCTCCIVDILRIFAPEAPYNNDDTIGAFKAIVTQLRGLATYDSVSSILTSKVYYILNSISTVQSCVVPVILGQSGVPGADEVVQAMFEALLASVRPEHPEEVLTHAAAVMQICIEELEGVTEELLDVLLLPLLPHNKTDNPTAYLLVAEVLRRVSSTIEAPLSVILQRILTGASHDSIGCSSEISEHIYSLVYELHKISSALLTNVLPDLCVQLQVEDEEIRLKAVKLLGSLFASPHADYAKDFNRDFKEYLGRCGDLSAEIRLEVVENCAVMLQNKPVLRAQLEDPLSKRLRDPDERVRMSALCKLVDLAYAHPTSLSAATYVEMGERAKDKRPEVRRLVMVGLAKIYGRHVSLVLPGLSSLSNKDARADSLRECVDTAVLARLEFIPGMLMKCWGYPEMGTKHLVLQLVQEQLLPKVVSSGDKDKDSETSSPCSDASSGDSARKGGIDGAELNDRRAAALLLMFEGLTAGDRNSLSAIMGFKSKARVELQSFLRIRATPIRTRASSVGGAAQSQSSSSSSSSSSASDGKLEMTAEEHMKALRKCMLRLMQVIPSVDKKYTYMEKLYSTKDRTIFRLLENCVSPKDSIVEAQTHREDLKKRLDSKSSLGEYMGIVYDVAGYMVANAGMVCSLLQHLENQGVSSDALVCSELLVVLAKHSPQAFQESVTEVSAWLSTCVGSESSSSSKPKHREARTTLLTQCLTTLSSTCVVFETDPHQPAFCSAIVDHIKQSSHADICARLSELVSQVVYYSPCDGTAASSKAEPSAVHATTSLLNALTAPKALSLQNKRLDCDLAALASLCVVPKAAYSALKFSKPSFLAMMDAIRAKASLLVSFVNDRLFAQSSADEATSVRTLTVGLRALTSVLCTLEELKQLNCGSSVKGADTEVSSSSSERVASTDFRDLVQLLFACIESNGESLSSFSTDSEEEKEFLFETAAACAFSLMKIKSFAAHLTVPQWHALGWTLLHPSPAVRQRLFSTLSLSIQMHPLHPKFLAYPCLFATDESLYPHAEQALGFAVQRLRRTHEELCSRAIGQANDAAKLQKLAESLMPEMILPYLLHLLSYHPEFPSSIAIDTEVDKRRMKNLVRSVRMLLHVLQSSLINDSSNMSYLFKQLNTINQLYLDRHNAANCELHFVTRMTVKILSEQVKTSDNIQNHPGEIHLPQELFQRKAGAVDGAEGNSAAMVVLGAGSASGLEVAERAIDKVLQLAGKGTKSYKTGACARPAATIANVRGSSHDDSDVTQIFKGRKRTSESPGENGARKSVDRARSSLGSAEKAAKEEKPSRLSEEAAPTRAVPKRSAKEAVVSYREPVENDKEMESWEAAAAQTKRPRRSSELSLPNATDMLRSSFSSSSAPRFSGGGGGARSSAIENWVASPPHVISPRHSGTASVFARSVSGKTTQDESDQTSAPSTPAVMEGEGSNEMDLFAEEAESPIAIVRSPVSRQGAVKARALKAKTNLPPTAPIAAPAKSKTPLFDAATRKGSKAGKAPVARPVSPVLETLAAVEAEPAPVGRPKRAVAAASDAPAPVQARRTGRPIRG